MRVPCQRIRDQNHLILKLRRIAGGRLTADIRDSPNYENSVDVPGVEVFSQIALAGEKCAYTRLDREDIGGLRTKFVPELGSWSSGMSVVEVFRCQFVAKNRSKMSRHLVHAGPHPNHDTAGTSDCQS